MRENSPSRQFHTDILFDMTLLLNNSVAQERVLYGDWTIMTDHGEYRYRKTAVYYVQAKPNLLEAVEVVLLGSILGAVLMGQSSLDNLPTQDQVSQILASLNGISTQLTTLSLSLTGLITPLTAIITGITAALGGVTTFINLIVTFFRGLIGFGRTSDAMQDSIPVMENILRMTLDRFPDFQSAENLMSQVIHGFSLDDVKPTFNFQVNDPSMIRNSSSPIEQDFKTEDFTQIDKFLWLSSNNDRVDFYQFDYKRQQVGD